LPKLTLSDEFSYGLEWYFNNGAKGKGFLDTGAAGITQLSPGFSFACWILQVPSGGAERTGGQLQLNIISSPHIMVADNRTAKIQVGDVFLQ